MCLSSTVPNEAMVGDWSRVLKIERRYNTLGNRGWIVVNTTTTWHLSRLPFGTLNILHTAPRNVILHDPTQYRLPRIIYCLLSYSPSRRKFKLSYITVITLFKVIWQTRLYIRLLLIWGAYFNICAYFDI